MSGAAGRLFTDDLLFVLVPSSAAAPGSHRGAPPTTSFLLQELEQREAAARRPNDLDENLLTPSGQQAVSEPFEMLVLKPG